MNFQILPQRKYLSGDAAGADADLGRHSRGLLAGDARQAG
jgi:hypothetical protein